MYFNVKTLVCYASLKQSKSHHQAKLGSTAAWEELNSKEQIQNILNTYIVQ